MLAAVSAVVALFGCEDSGEVSAERAGKHAEHLTGIITKDVEEIRRGLPEGAKIVAEALKDEDDPAQDPERTKLILETARAKVQDLRVAKSSFFAFVKPDGTVVRNNRDQDMMAGKNILTAFPTLEQAVSGKYTEAVGSMPEARGVEGKPDGQWVAAEPVKGSDGTVGLFVTGWAWSIYAKRLEAALRTHILDSEKEGPQPLAYVFIVTKENAYGTPPSPEVNSEAIMKLDPQKLVSGDGVVTQQLEITGRSFGLGLQRVRALGDGVIVAVLRSET